MFDSARKNLPDEDYILIVRSLFAERFAITVGAAVTTTAAASIYLHTDAPIMAGFALVFLIFGMIRFSLCAAFDRADKAGLSADQAAKWEQRLTFATCSLALTYGLWSFSGLVFVEDPFAALASTMVSIAVLIGLTTRNFAADRLVTISSMSIALPLAAGLLIKGEIYYALIGILLMPFLFSLRKLAADVRSIFLAAVHGRMDATRLAEELDSALGTMPHGLCMIDAEGRVLVINDQARRMLQIENQIEVTGRPVDALLFFAMSKRMITKSTARVLAAELTSKTNSKLVIGLADNRHCEVTTSSQHGHTVLMLEDITDRVLAETKITNMARYDSLTQLPNRSFFSEQAKARLSEIAAWDRPLPVMVTLIDIDDFKHVNDTLGHLAGDRLIKQAADRLAGLFGENALVARFGGDEFIVFRTGEVTNALAEEDAAAISAAFRIPFHLDSGAWSVTTSIGIVVANGAEIDLDEFLTRADLALHDAKTRGKACWSVFREQMDIDYRQRQQLKTQFESAIENDQLFVTYQPIIDIRTRGLAGCEALVRWRHPELGIVSPAMFIPLAEEMGAITELSRFVLAEATRQCLLWPEHMSVSVNLSAHDFRITSVEQMVADALANSGLAANRLIVEITETALIDEPAKASQALAGLRAKGVGVALDDFGTGYSALDYLTTMTFSKLKIDRSFTRDIATDARARKLLVSVARLSHDLDMSVTVEGVETEAQLQVIIDNTHIEHAQGFLFGPPLSAKDIGELIERMTAPTDQEPERKERVIN